MEIIENAGINKEQATAFATTIKESHDNSDVVTKGDLRELELTIKAELLLLRWMIGFIFAGILSLIIKSFF